MTMKIIISLVFILLLEKILSNEIKKTMKNFDDSPIIAEDGLQNDEKLPENQDNVDYFEESSYIDTYNEISIKNKAKNEYRHTDFGQDYDTKLITMNNSTLYDPRPTFVTGDNDVDKAEYRAYFTNLIMLSDSYYEFSINKLMLIEKQTTHKANITYSICLNYNEQETNGNTPDDKMDLFLSLNLFRFNNMTILKEYAKFKAGFLNDIEREKLKTELCLKNQVIDTTDNWGDCLTKPVNEKLRYAETIKLSEFPESKTTSFVVDSSNLCNNATHDATLTNFDVKIKMEVEDSDKDYRTVLMWYII